MNEQEVKEMIGFDNWEEFSDWIAGQTCGINEDGTIDYYEWDVKRFVGYIGKTPKLYL